MCNDVAKGGMETQVSSAFVAVLAQHKYQISNTFVKKRKKKSKMQPERYLPVSKFQNVLVHVFRLAPERAHLLASKQPFPQE